MKNLLLITGLAVGLSSCADVVVVDANVLNTATGKYSVDLISVSTSGWAGGIDSDTTIEDLCLIYFEYGGMYTLNNNEEIQQIPILGFNFQDNFFFETSRSADSLMIGGGVWYIVEASADNNIDGDVNLTRVTNYNGMGTDIQTMVLTEL